MVRKPFGNPLRLPATRSVGAIPILATLAALACAPSAASYPPDQPHLLTTVAQVRATYPGAGQARYPIHLKGVITYRAPEYKVTFFQDETAGIFVSDRAVGFADHALEALLRWTATPLLAISPRR